MVLTLLERARRHKGILIVLVLTATAGWAAVTGPRGLKTLLEKREEIRLLQEENAALEAENKERLERIHRLESDRTEQEYEIRKQLRLQRENEKTFILPEAAAPEGSPQPR